MADSSRYDPRGTPRRENRGPRQGGSPGGRDRQNGPGGNRPQSGVSGRAAVPWYVGQNFGDAPPGHRYLSYLPFWKRDWRAINEGKQKVLKDVGALSGHVQGLMRALAARQCTLGQMTGAEVISAISTSPFATGLGWEHPNENGFAFLQPYGLPYLAGSGVKGVVRHAAQQLAKEQTEAHGWNDNAIEALFGLEPSPGSEKATRGALRFFDVLPEIAGNALDVDIMNPHYRDYYEAKKTAAYPNGTTPHDAASPIPIFFLVVPPGSKFTFVVDCPRERYLPPEVQVRWRGLIRTAFSYAFDWLGFGAKTAVGYGAMKEITESSTDISEHGTERIGLSANPPGLRDAVFGTHHVVWESTKITWQPGPKLVTAAVRGEKPAYAQGKAAEDFIAALSAELRATLERRKELNNVTVVVEISGNQRTLKRPQ